MLKSLTYLFLIAGTAICSHAQKLIPGTTDMLFSLKSKNDTIDFIVSRADLSVKKPVFFFAQGSMPIPLYAAIPGQGTFSLPLGNFDLENLTKKFHLVVISMPKTPVVVGPENLTPGYAYTPDTSKPNGMLDAFVLADHLDNYLHRANQVLKFLSKQKWVDNSRLIAAGHSQGSRIVAELAATNPKITHAGLFGFSALGRVHERVWLNYKEAMKGTISWEKLDELQQEQYRFQQEIASDKGEDIGLIAWKSFRGIGFERLANIQTPLYIAYGTEDKCAFLNELIPLYFIESGKTNYEVKRYPNLEHNYFPVVNGEPDYANGKWAEVMNEFAAWALKD